MSISKIKKILMSKTDGAVVSIIYSLDSGNPNDVKIKIIIGSGEFEKTLETRGYEKATDVFLEAIDLCDKFSR